MKLVATPKLVAFKIFILILSVGCDEFKHETEPSIKVDSKDSLMFQVFQQGKTNPSKFPKQTILKAAELKKLAQEFGSEKYLAYVHYLHALVESGKKNRLESIIYGDSALLIATMVGDSFLLPKIYQTMGVNYALIGDLNKATEYLLKQYHMTKNRVPNDNFLNLLSNLSELSLDNYDELNALEYAREGAKLSPIYGDTYWMIMFNLHKAECFRSLKLLDSAEINYRKAIEIGEIGKSAKDA